MLMSVLRVFLISEKEISLVHGLAAGSASRDVFSNAVQMKDSFMFITSLTLSV